MTLPDRIRLNWRYLRGNTPWDSGRVPPELEDFLAAHLPGRALDIGCGTGTNSIRLAQAGWDVVAVDMAWVALWKARRKARRAGVRVDFRLDDAGQLKRVTGAFDLALDIGCFHTLPKRAKRRYLNRLDDLLVSGGWWLLYGFFAESASDIGLQENDFDFLPAGWHLQRREDGQNPHNQRPSAWFWFQKI